MKKTKRNSDYKSEINFIKRRRKITNKEKKKLFETL